MGGGGGGNRTIFNVEKENIKEEREKTRERGGKGNGTSLLFLFSLPFL